MTGGYVQDGGGIFCDYLSSPTVENCIITENTALGFAGGIAIQGSSPVIRSCVVASNTSEIGGGFCLSAASSAELHNCTVVGNNAQAGGGYLIYSDPLIANCIIAYQLNGGALGFYDVESPRITCTDIVGNGGGDWVGRLQPLANEYGNMSLEPLFCDTLTGNYGLLPNSPCAPASNECGELIGALPVGCDPTDVDDPKPDYLLPSTYALYQNYPNPFNPSTTIDFDLPVKSHVEIAVYNILGQRTATLVDGDHPAGQHHVARLGLDDQGHPLASGDYFYRIKADSFVQSRKMLLLK